MFDAILTNISRVQDYNPSVRFFEWVFPRQSGVTSWILKQIQDDISSGRTIAYVHATKHSYAKELMRLDEQLYSAYVSNQVVLINESTMHRLKGRSVDRTYGDNFIYWSPRNRVEFLNCYIPTLVGGNRYMLSLNTTDGTFKL